MSTRLIGLSLGADHCWPACYEEIVRRMDLSLPKGKEKVDFAVERVRVEPFDLRAKCRYDLVLDRITHWFPTTREWIKKIALDGVYVFNNPWMIQSAEKHTTYVAMMRLGFPIPETWMIPPKEYADEPDTITTIRRYNNLFSLEATAEKVGYPLFMKPYDGGAWRGVNKVDDTARLHKSYNESGKQVMHLQKGVDGFDLFVRAIGIGPQVNCIKYDAGAPLHARYTLDKDFMDAAGWETMTRYARVINAFFCWDYNSCEALRADGVFHPIDFANACPDSQVTSLHYHFPWTVRSLVGWSLYCAYSQRKPRVNPNWQPYFDIADTDLPFPEKLAKYDALARDYFEVEKFEEFRRKHLKNLDEITIAFFQTERAKDIFREKVAMLSPKHEIEEFTDRFFGQVQQWCADEAGKLGKG